MLNSLKRELGIPVEFAGDKAQSLAGEGDVPTKATAAYMWGVWGQMDSQKSVWKRSEKSIDCETCLKYLSLNKQICIHVWAFFQFLILLIQVQMRNFNECKVT